MAADWTIRLIGILFLIAAFVIKYRIGRRKFYRRSITGLEQFSSYSKAWFTRSMEALAKLTANLFILAGIACILLSLL